MEPSLSNEPGFPQDAPYTPATAGEAPRGIDLHVAYTYAVHIEFENPPMATRTPAPSQKQTVSISGEPLGKARRLGINLSQTLEVHLAELVRQVEARAWLEQNKAAIGACNERIAREGIWSDGLREF